MLPHEPQYFLRKVIGLSMVESATMTNNMVLISLKENILIVKADIKAVT